MNMISEAYLEQQKALHALGKYGISGHKHVTQVDYLARKLGTTDILDYGCGQCSLENELGFAIRNYDPAIPKYADRPTYPADIVVCTDVLEHVEPEYLDEVLDDLKRLTRQFGYFAIPSGPAKKVLSDGRNAHLIQEKAEWWLPKLRERFQIAHLHEEKKGFVVIVRPL